ncbi:MAG TPA: MFS transporter [Bryobacteraceae bacterium]|nr:MFS transporter [Bryobacteraceae bacterium]
MKPVRAVAGKSESPAGGRTIIALLFFAAAINYIDRGSLSVAAPALAAQLKLDPVQMGVLLSAFFWTYAGFQSFAGWLTDRFPVTWVFGLGFAVWSAATLGSGFAIGVASLFAFRLVLGAAESVAFPCYSKVIAAGFPVESRGVPNSLIEAGTKLGPAIGTLIGAVIVAHYGWRVLFWALGGFSLIWLIPWILWAPRQPRSSSPVARRNGVSMGQIIARRDAWGTFIGNACYTYAYYFLLTWLPSYLVQERHLSMEMMGVLGSVPYWAAAGAAVVSGWISDAWIRSGATPTRVRKTFVATGLLLSTVMVPAALVSDLSLSIALLCLGYVAFGIFASNHWAITQTLAGTSAAGTWTGIQNTLGSLSGIVAPIVTGFIVSRTGSFFWAFVSPALLAVVGACSYLFLVGRVAPIAWRKQEAS